jgi:hypothetical protein
MAAAGPSTSAPQFPTTPSSALATQESRHVTVSKSDSPPFSTYLQLVAFTATITISVSISASQGFATGGNFFGIPLTNETDPITTAAVRATTDAANWLAWAAAASSVSLMIALILQLMQTDEIFLNALEGSKEGYGRHGNIPRIAVGAGSWIALGLQASALALMGQALKAINKDSGSMIQVSTTHTKVYRIGTDFFSQWALLAVGVAFSSVYLVSIGHLQKLKNIVS